MYDYVIVGAGSAGCVLANRLTEDSSTSVLLLEAGGEDSNPAIHIPIAFSTLFQTTYDWAYKTEAQAHMNNRCLDWPRGKMLGGSSSMNVMMYIRGHASDYNQWRDLGNLGWGYADVLPYFRKAEKQERGASIYHGANGPLHVADLRSPNVLSHLFLDAGIQIGLSHNDDFNGAQQEGIGLAQVTQKGGVRNSTAAAYLRPALKRPNLTVLTCAQVQRIIFDGRRAIGVIYRREGREEQVTVGREVLLCAGTINSAQLLLLSGVGPAEQLQHCDIPVIANRPGVGQNLIDHLLLPVSYTSKRPVTLASAKRLQNLLLFQLFKKGPLTSNIGEAALFYKTCDDLSAPDLEIVFGPAFFPDQNRHGFTFAPILLAPKSRGYLALRSPDPEQPPLIQPSYLEREEDVEVLIKGVKLARRLVQAPAFDLYRGEEAWPHSSIQDKQEIADFIRENANTAYHPVGTCKMGGDAMAVVDSELRVHEVEQLRVIDASIMPTIISGHTNAAAIMIAEKAADIIKEAERSPLVLQVATSEKIKNA